MINYFCRKCGKHVESEHEHYDYLCDNCDQEINIDAEIITYVNMIKKVLDREYGKEVVFYDSGEWYSRDHCKLITLEELEKYLLEVTYKEEYHD